MNIAGFSSDSLRETKITDRAIVFPSPPAFMTCGGPFFFPASCNPIPRLARLKAEMPFSPLLALAPLRPRTPLMVRLA